MTSERIEHVENVGQRRDDVRGDEAAFGAEQRGLCAAVAPAAAARRPSMPFARNAAIVPVRTSPVPAVASDGGPKPQTSTPSPGAATIVSAPFSRQTQPKRSTARAAASRRCASTHDGSTPSRPASSPECGVSTVGASRSNGSSSNSASASTTAGSSVSTSSRRTSSRRASSRPRPGPIASAPAFSTASKTSSSGRFTASSRRVSSTGSDSAGAATAT